MKILSSILLASALVFSTAVMAKDFTILNEPDGSTTLKVRCSSGTSLVTLKPGEQTDIGDSSCRSYTVSISTGNGTRNGHIIEYTLDGGHSYYVYLNDRGYWDVAEN